MTDYKISVSVTHESIPPQLDVVQGDSGRNLVITIADLDTVGATARVYVLKPSKEEVYNSAKVIDGNIVVNLTKQMLAEVGQTQLQVSIYKGITPERVSSFLIYLNIQPSLQDNGRILSSSEYAALDEAISRVDKAVEKINTLKYAASDTVGGNAKVADKTKAGLNIKLNGTSQGIFDGSTAKEININYSSTGAAPASHSHNASNINVGTMNAGRLPVIPVSKGGTGATTPSPALANLGGMPKTGGTFSGNVEFSKTAVFADDTAFQQGYRLGSLATKETTCQIGKNLQSYNNVIQSLATGVHLCAADNNSYVYLHGAGVQCRDLATEKYIPVIASAFAQQSSRKFKKNIKNMQLSEANKLYQLNPVTFDYKQGEQDMAGLIAEDVEPLLPNVCSYGEEESGEKTLFGIDYTRFIPYLVKLAQEQKKEIDELKTEIEELKKLINKNKAL